MSVWPAGVAYTHPSLGYQTVNLGFGMPYMMESVIGRAKYVTGITDRVDLVANIMEYFGKAPTATPTGVDDDATRVCRLGNARPNPFNPVTTIDFSLAADCRATIRVFDASGRVVRTLLDREMDAGDHAVSWDGTTDGGERAASGVYFLKLETEGYRESRKMVLLK